MVHAEFLRQFRTGELNGVRSLGCAVPLIRPAGRDVRVVGGDVEPNVVTQKQRQALGTRIHRDGQGVSAVGAGVGRKVHLDRRQLAVLLSAQCDLDRHRVAGARGDELLLAGEFVENRPAGHPGGIGRDLLEHDVLFRPESAADTLLDHPNLVLADAQNPRDNPANVPRNLGRGMNHQAIAVHPGVHDVRLQRRALHLRRLVLACDDDLGLAQPQIEIADTARHGGRDVTARVGMDRELVDDLAVAGIRLAVVEVRRSADNVLEHTVMKNRSARGRGLVDGEHRLQHLVLDLDLPDRLYRDGGGFGHDRRHAVANVQQLLSEHLAVIGRWLGKALPGLIVIDVRAVPVGQNQDDARGRLGLCRVDLLDVGVGVRRAQHLEVAGARLHHVFDKGLVSADQTRAVNLQLDLADHAEIIPELGRRSRCRSGRRRRVLDTLSREFDRREELFISGAAAEDA